MKSIIKNGESATINYPCLKRYKQCGVDKVVLFTGIGKGVVVYCNDEKEIGDEAGYTNDETWTEKDFYPFSGTIELSNN